jgi:hypothetical protein
MIYPVAVIAAYISITHEVTVVAVQRLPIYRALYLVILTA